MNTSPSNNFLILLFLERYHQNSQAVLAVTDMNVKIEKYTSLPLHIYISTSTL